MCAPAHLSWGIWDPFQTQSVLDVAQVAGPEVAGGAMSNFMVRASVLDWAGGPCSECTDGPAEALKTRTPILPSWALLSVGCWHCPSSDGAS